MQLSLLTILGFIVGIALHASLQPKRHDMGTFFTLLLGLSGSLAGCIGGAHLSHYQPMGFPLAGFAASVIGACALVAAGDQLTAFTQTAAKCALAQRSQRIS